MSFRLSLLPILMLCLLPLDVLAHGASSEQLKNLTEQIQRTPNNVDLYLRRGDLYRQLGNAKAALADFDVVQRIAPERYEVDLYRARLFLDANVPEIAEVSLNRLLEKRPNQTEALLFRAQAYSKLGVREAAIKDYSEVLRSLTEPRPEVFIARAQLQVDSHQYQAAIIGLDEGIAKLGPLVTLQTLAIEIEVRRKGWEAALARMDAVTAQMPRKEIWLMQRAEILLQAGRRAEARQTLSTIQELIASLPDHLRKAPAITTLIGKTTELLARTKEEQ